MARNPKRVKRRFVDYLAHDEDHECALLGALGFSSRMILRRTGLETPGQVQYRLHKAEISRMAFRDGTSPWAKAIMQEMCDAVEPGMSEYLRKYSTPHQKKVTGGYVKRRPKSTPRRHSGAIKG